MSGAQDADLGNAHRMRLRMAIQIATLKCERAGGCQCAKFTRLNPVGEIFPAGGQPEQGGAVADGAEIYVLDCGETVRLLRPDGVHGYRAEVFGEATRLDSFEIMRLAANSEPDAAPFDPDTDVLRFENGHWVPLGEAEGVA